MTPLIAYGFLAGGTAVAARWCHLSRMVGGVMIVAGALALASPAHADEHVLARDNSEVACTVSKSGLTRISLKDDRFSSVSKLTTGNDTEDFTVVNEPTRGDIYLSVPDGFARSRVSFFGTTAKGYVYKFACRLGADDAQQIFVENKDISADGTRDIANTRLSLQEASASLVEAMYRSAPLDGFDMVPTTTDPVMVGLLKVQMVAEYRGAALAGRVLRIENKGRDAVTLGEGSIAPSNAIAVTVATPRLAPGAATTAYIVTPTALTSGALP